MENKQTEKRSLLKKIGITKEQVFYLLIADVFYALALNLFYVGNKIAAGGFAGIATVINAFIPIPVGTAVFLMSIPVVIVAWKVKGGTYTLMALATTAVYSIIVDVLSFLPTITDDMIVAVVCGGIFYGLGASMAIKAHMSSGGTDLLGKVLITKDLARSIEGKHILIIEDIVDTGQTLHLLKEMLEKRKPASLEIVTLLDKPERRKVEFQADLVGFSIPDRFVVGWGMDYNQKYRELPYIGIINE